MSSPDLAEVLRPPYTVLQVPASGFEDLVRSRLERWAPDFLRRDGGLHAHITVLAPFLPEAELDAGALAALHLAFAAVPAFTVRCARLGRFPDGLVHAVPEPATPLRALTASVVALWPHLRPYGGIKDAAPHVSLDHARPDSPAGEIPPDLLAEAHLPVDVPVTAVELVSYCPGETRALHRFPLHRQVAGPSEVPTAVTTPHPEYQ